ncbi:hypothetical protein [Spirosoma litoris]
MTTTQQPYGADTPLPPLTELQMGPMTVCYENGSFRYFRWGGHEILRMIYFAIRDQNWATWTPIISDEQWIIEPNGFRLSYTCHYESDGTTPFVWKVVAEGNATGEFSITIDGIAHQTFLKNRAGFCILHPIQGTAGQPCELIHADGSVELARFPEAISPANPFKQLAGMRWLQAGGQWFKLEMTGDIFETEDQRNWSDASFKTFCTPQDRPFPVTLHAGESVYQRIHFRPEQPLLPLAESGPEAIFIRVEEDQRTDLPALGLGASTEIPVLGVSVVRALQEYAFDHYRVDVTPGQPGWMPDFLQEVATGQRLGWPLLVALHLSTNHIVELRAFLDVVSQQQVTLAELLLLSTEGPATDADMLAVALETIRTELPQTRVGAGTNYYFVDLNRNRISTVGLDFISYTAQPQVHAFDNRTIVENLGGLADTVRTAKTFSGKASVYVSPITICHRLNPDARNPADRLLSNAQKTDPRHPTRWAAGWTVGSIKQLAETGAKAATYYQTAGYQGILSEEAHLYPIAVVFAQVLEFQGGQVIRTHTSNPLSCSTLLLVDGDRRRWLVANHTDQPLPVQLPEPVREGYRITSLPSTKTPLELEDSQRLLIEPFGVWILECT